MEATVIKIENAKIAVGKERARLSPENCYIRFL